ncbi:Hypothetical protein, putative [Bodo saltans]|uniref:Calponin-homology (CH) domain-containing protein n=1 Tax=Bodo saltans TaxID=75058 RepID=A0A0S4IZJ7_BODSA|nr:Hypothetical protein, putative [Bodo saltans]|eukprot:CUG63555.1 Hypothetical protein, putative [Bodo saltans]
MERPRPSSNQFRPSSSHVASARSHHGLQARLRHATDHNGRGPLVPSPPCIPGGLPGRLSTAVAGVAYAQLVHNLLTDGGHHQMSSLINQCALAYHHMIQTTRDLAFPNPLRTSFCCAMIDKIFTAESLHDTSDFVNVLKADLFSSLFFNTTPDLYMPSKATELDSTLSRFKVHSHYFTELEIATTERDELLAEMQSKRQVNTKEFALLERIIFRWQTMMVDRLFGAWRNVVCRRKRWLQHLEQNSSSKQRLKRLSQSFSCWKDISRYSHVQRQLQASLHRNKEQESSEEGLLREYAKLVAGIEALKAEKQMLQDTVRRSQDEIVTLKVGLEQLQGRLDQQRTTTAAWKDMALQLCMLVSRNTPDMNSDQQTEPNPGVGSILLRNVSSAIVSPVGSMRHGLASHRDIPTFDHPLGESPVAMSRSPGAMMGFATAGSSIDISSTSSPVHDVDLWEETLLVWLNGTLQSSKTGSGLRRESTVSPIHDNNRRKPIQNFSSDFMDGSVLLDLVDSLKAAPEVEIMQLRSEKQRAQSTEVNYKQLQNVISLLVHRSGVSPNVRVDPLDVATGNAADALRLLIAHLMAASPQVSCPVCDSSHEPLVLDSGQAQKKLSLYGMTTITDVQQRISGAVRHHQTRRAEMQTILQRAWTSMIGAPTSSLPDDALFKYVVLEAMMKVHVTRERLDEIVERSRLAVRRELEELVQVFRLFGARDDRLSTQSWMKQINFARPVFRFPAKRLSLSLVNEAPQTLLDAGIINFTTFSALLTFIAISNAWILAKQSVPELLIIIEPELSRVLGGIKGVPEILARSEINNIFSLSHVHSIFKDATTLLAKLWAGTAHSTIGMTQERFVQVLKESKCLDKHCTIENVKKVFALLVDNEDALMSFDEFGKSLLAISLWKDASPTTNSAIKFKRLLDDLAVRALKH